VHVEDDEDPVPLGAVDGGHDLVEVRLVERTLGGLEVVPEHHEAHVVHAPGGGVGQELIAGVGGRIAGLHVEPVELQGAPPLVGDVDPPVRALGRRPPGHRAGRLGRRRHRGRRRGGRHDAGAETQCDQRGEPAPRADSPPFPLRPHGPDHTLYGRSVVALPAH
jgi:hypothetical protein